MSGFQASSQGTGSSADLLRNISGESRDMWSAFQRDMADYDDWMGHGDEFAAQVTPNWNASMANIHSAGEAIFGAIEAAADSTDQHARTFRDLQSDNVAAIQTPPGGTHH
jgi:hypothetical protein